MGPHLSIVSQWLMVAGLVCGGTVEQVKAALEAITVHGIENIKGNIHLPNGTSEGLEISWFSSDENIISTDGWVSRQEKDTNISLTASIIADDGTKYDRLFDARVKAAVQLAEFEGYLFSYFTNSSRAGENIYFAASNGNDALSWIELNEGQPSVRSSQGTKGLRDPFLIRSPEGDTFYLIATDLSIGSGTSWDTAVRHGSQYLEIWESSDLIHWSEQRHVRVSPENAGNTWAPEAFYDKELGAYVVFWASSLYDEQDVDHKGASYHRMLYAVTRDFRTFTEPTIWQDAGMSRIDSTVLEEDGTYFRFTKDEGAGGTGCSDIIQESSTSLRGSLELWSQVTACIGRKAGTKAVEGPTIFKSNPRDIHGEKFYLFVDEYVDRGYIPLATTDISKPNWTVPDSFNLPRSPRHGTVLPVTAAELKAIREASEGGKEEDDYSGPVLPGFFADPNIVVFDGDCNYYIYATTDGVPNWGGKDFYVWRSRDLVNWVRSANPFLTLDGPNGNVPWAAGNAWAPTIIKREDKYYFYFSGHNPIQNAKNMGVAISASPTGPFTAVTESMIKGTEAVRTSGSPIDPHVFHDPVSGKYYIYWGNGTPVYAQLNDDMVSVNWDTAANMNGLTGYREASFMVYRNGTYHLTYSIDDTRSENYRVGYASSTTPEGPWTYHGVILEKNVSLGILGTGHSSIVNVPSTDDWYIAYHRFGIPNGNGTRRETTIDKLKFNRLTGLIDKVTPTLNGVGAQLIPGCAACKKRAVSSN
jgi:beta-xylosidase